MDKETLSNYGWIVICVLVLAVMLALATPFGTFVADAVKATTAGFFNVNQNAMGTAGIIIPGQEFESCDHDYEVTTTGDCATGTTSTHTCKLCGKTYTETTPAGHKYDDTGLTCTQCGVTVVEYSFSPSDYDAKMGTTTATDANVVIPETFEYNGKTYKVTSVKAMAFQNNKTIENVTMPNSVTAIYNRAFEGCSSLKSVNIPDGVTVIGWDAFEYCGSLSCPIVIPEGVTTLGGTTFYGCRSIPSVEFKGNNLTKIDYNCFMHCESITSIIIPASVTEIGNQAFGDCYALEEITILGKPTMTLYSINYCRNLKTINVSWSEGEVENFPCPQNPTDVVINYNYTGK